MNWLNLKTSQLREPTFIGSEPVARATWLCVLTYCVEMENGGRITGARLWKDRQWQQTCGVMLSEVLGAVALLSWEGDDLIIWAYPTDKESEVRTRRETAQENGKRGGRPPKPKSTTTEEETHTEPPLVAVNNQRPKAEGERNENENENGKGNTPNPPSPEPTVVVANEASAAPASPSRRVGIPKDDRPTAPEAIAIATLFRRRLETHWTDKEIKAYRDGIKRGIITLASIEEIEPYYAAERAKGDGENGGRHRRDIKTFLNNFAGELDRARALKARSKNGATPEYLKTEWPTWLKANGHAPVEYQFAAEFLRSDFHAARKAAKA